VPVTHLEQAVAAVEEYVPATQLKHDDADEVARYVPLAHAVHTLDADAL